MAVLPGSSWSLSSSYRSLEELCGSKKWFCFDKFNKNMKSKIFQTVKLIPAFKLKQILLIYRVIQNDCRGFNNLSYTIHLRYEYIVAPTDQEILSFLLWCAMCSSYAFLRLERSLLRWRRKAVRRLYADMLQTVWNELDFRVDVCRITKGAHIEHL